MLGAVLAAAAIGLGTLLVQSLGDDGAQEPHRTASGHTGQTFTARTLEKQVADLLSEGSGSPSSRPSIEVESSPQDPRSGSALRDPTVQVPDCIRRGIGRSDAALAVEEGTYEDTSAYLVVLPDVSDATKVVAYVVDASCRQQPAGTKGKVLLTHSYARR